MANEIISLSTFTAYVKSEANLDRYAEDNDTAITEAIAAGNGEGLAALRRSGRYSSSAIDALTSSTAPSDLQSFVHARALHHLTKNGGKRSELIDKAAEEAAKTLSFIATGNYLVSGITEASTAGIEYELPDALSFDNLNEDSGAYYRDQDI